MEKQALELSLPKPVWLISYFEVYPFVCKASGGDKEKTHTYTPLPFKKFVSMYFFLFLSNFGLIIFV